MLPINLHFIISLAFVPQKLILQFRKTLHLYDLKLVAYGYKWLIEVYSPKLWKNYPARFLKWPMKQLGSEQVCRMFFQAVNVASKWPHSLILPQPRQGHSSGVSAKWISNIIEPELNGKSQLKAIKSQSNQSNIIQNLDVDWNSIPFGNRISILLSIAFDCLIGSIVEPVWLRSSQHMQINLLSSCTSASSLCPAFSILIV